MRRVTLILTVVALASCATNPRFEDRPIVWKVDDSRDIPEPAEREYYAYPYFADVLVINQASRALELHDDEPAHNTNALDEVPDSTWFTNRIGVRDLTPEEVATGPVVDGPPQKPLKVVSGKIGGGAPGFIIEDGRGIRYIIKLDTMANPRMETATGVLVNRFFWALGYHVPQDTLFRLRPEDLAIAEGARYKNDLLEKKPIDRAFIDSVFAIAPAEADGSYRALASRFLDGTPRGGWPAEGTRDDDPNDVVPHEHRRELRGLKVFSAWLGHTDMKEDNTLEMYVEEDGRRFLRRYLVDFDEALGAHQAEKERLEDGYEHVWDWSAQTRAFFALGLWVRAWESQEQTKWLSVGAFSADHFDPEGWKVAYPYWPFDHANDADLYWGAKHVVRFDRALIRAAVETGELSPEATDYLVETLIKRRDLIGREWLERVTPLDYFEIVDESLCAWDLGVQHGLASDGIVEILPAEYQPEFDDPREIPLPNQRVHSDGRVCVPIGDADYQILRLRVRRGSERKPVMQVHVRGGDQARVLGVVRVEDL